MPRPAINRRRQNSFNRFSPKRLGGLTDSTTHREYLQKKLAHKPIGNKPENSDDSDGIVTSQRFGRNRKQFEIYASGAVAKGDKPGAFPTRAQRTRALRSDTDEILSQRSRSTSRAASVASVRSAQPVAAPEEVSETAKDASSAKRRKIDRADANVDDKPPNVRTEKSILGAIKPRKRQNSILETMGISNDDLGPDSSGIHSGDEERFLPDEVSTPAQDQRNGVRTEITNSTSSLKRKRGAEVIPSRSNVRSSSPLSSVPSEEESPVRCQPELPRPSRSQQKKLRSSKSASKTDATGGYDVMAPPESSDSEDSSEETGVLSRSPVKVKKDKPIAISTQQLQHLMPSKQEKPLSVGRPRDEFEMEVDSTSRSEDEVDDLEEHSSFSPIKTRRGQKRNSTRLTGKGKENTRKTMTKGGKTTSKGKAGTKSTNKISHTPSPARLRAPLPLSSSKPRRPEAKSPSKQDTIMRDKSANTPVPTRATRGEKRRYGGFRRREAGKENRPISLSDERSGSDTSLVDENKVKAARQQANGPEIKAWTKKWGDIDDFELDFEEVSASTRSSSPTGMAR